MMDAIRRDETPHFYFLHYDLAFVDHPQFAIEFPSFAFSGPGLSCNAIRLEPL